MASIGDVAAKLRAALTLIEGAAASLKTADDRLEGASGPLQADLADSSNPLTHEGLGQWRTARERLAEALALITGGAERMGEYIASIAGSAGSSGGASPTIPSRSSGEVRVPQDRPVPGFDPQRLNPTVERIMRRVGWPKRSDGKTSARGLLFTPDGRSWTETPLRASRKGPASRRTDLKTPWSTDPEITTRHHIEGNAAALMVKHGQRGAVLYLNIPPCGDPSRPDPKRCHPNIPAVLPEGYTLTVHTVREDGGHSRTVYRGTGEAIT